MKNRKQYTLAIGWFFALQTAFSQVEIPMKLNIQNLDWSPDGKSLVLSALLLFLFWNGRLLFKAIRGRGPAAVPAVLVDLLF